MLLLQKIKKELEQDTSSSSSSKEKNDVSPNKIYAKPSGSWRSDNIEYNKEDQFNIKSSESNVYPLWWPKSDKNDKKEEGQALNITQQQDNEMIQVNKNELKSLIQEMIQIDRLERANYKNKDNQDHDDDDIESSQQLQQSEVEKPTEQAEKSTKEEEDGKQNFKKSAIQFTIDTTYQLPNSIKKKIKKIHKT